jgi:hypothetical protein
MRQSRRTPKPKADAISRWWQPFFRAELGETMARGARLRDAHAAVLLSQAFTDDRLVEEPDALTVETSAR